MEGATSVIIPVLEGYVEKKHKRRSNQRFLDLQQEIILHREIAGHIEKTMKSMGVAVPKLLPATARYIMEEVDTSCPLNSEDVWDSFTDEKRKDIEWRLRIFIKSMASLGIFLRDVEAYYNAQADLITFLDFGQAYKGEPTAVFKIESAAIFPPSIMKRLEGAVAREDE
jgi:hypothetical protein